MRTSMKATTARKMLRARNFWWTEKVVCFEGRPMVKFTFEDMRTAWRAWDALKLFGSGPVDNGTAIRFEV